MTAESALMAPLAGGALGAGQKETCAQVPAAGVVLRAHLGQLSLPQCLWKGFEEGPWFKETLLW